MNVKEIRAETLDGPDAFLREVAEPCQPVVIRALVRSWPAFDAAQRSPKDFSHYVSQFDAGGSAEVYLGEPHIAGRYYYTEDLKRFNFERKQMPFAEALERIVSNSENKSVYLGSVPTQAYLPGFAKENALPILKESIAPRIWLGHASKVAAHYDTLDNVACVVAGRRRFTLYSPELIGDLYVGPIDHNMAGQPVSLAASAPPGDERYPRFEPIRDQALVAELEPGDAIYIPKLWWHQVEATSEFNVLVNYWWDAFNLGPDAPSTGLFLSMITIAERPLAERMAWKAFFDHYVFRTNGHPLAHVPPSEHGVLGPLKQNYGRLRAYVMQMLRGG